MFTLTNYQKNILQEVKTKEEINNVVTSGSSSRNGDEDYNNTCRVYFRTTTTCDYVDIFPFCFLLGPQYTGKLLTLIHHVQSNPYPPGILDVCTEMPTTSLPLPCYRLYTFTTIYLNLFIIQDNASATKKFMLDHYDIAELNSFDELLTFSSIRNIPTRWIPWSSWTNIVNNHVTSNLQITRVIWYSCLPLTNRHRQMFASFTWYVDKSPESVIKAYNRLSSFNMEMCVYRCLTMSSIFYLNLSYYPITKSYSPSQCTWLNNLVLQKNTTTAKWTDSQYYRKINGTLFNDMVVLLSAHVPAIHSFKTTLVVFFTFGIRLQKILTTKIPNVNIIKSYDMMSADALNCIFFGDLKNSKEPYWLVPHLILVGYATQAELCTTFTRIVDISCIMYVYTNFSNEVHKSILTINSANSLFRAFYFHVYNQINKSKQK